MSNPSNPISREIEDIFRVDEEDSDEEDSDEEDSDEEDSDEEVSDEDNEIVEECEVYDGELEVNFENLPLYKQMPDGSFTRISQPQVYPQSRNHEDPLLVNERCLQIKRISGVLSDFQLTSSDSEDDLEHIAASSAMQNTVYIYNELPLSSATKKSPNPEQQPMFQIEMKDEASVDQEKTLKHAQSSSRSSGLCRGRGRDRRRLRRAYRSVREQGEWIRGQPLIERFVSDRELPEWLRQDISQIQAARNRRNRVAAIEKEGFTWNPMSEWNGVRERFLPIWTGPTRQFDNSYDALHSIWDDSIMNHIVTATNNYAQTIRSGRFNRDYFQTNIDEIWIMFAFWMMLGIVRMPTIKSCFTQMPLLKTHVFRLLFTETRYWNLNRAFHCGRTESTNDETPEFLRPIEPIITHLNNKFQELYRLDQEICIDESLKLWKAPLSMKKYIKTKSAQHGIKSFQICESSTGYMWNFFIYGGRAGSANGTIFTEATPSPRSHVSTVFRILKPLLNLGHTVYMDNWFNSPKLAHILKRNHTDCVGTLRDSKKHVPPVIQRAPLTEGQFVARASDNVMVVAVQDSRRVTFLSTFHDVSQVVKQAKGDRPKQHKLQLVENYNQGMRGVDRLDQMLEPYLIERKQCKKWTKKLFKRLLNITIQNARVLVEKSTKAKVDSLAFRMALVQEIIKRHLHMCPRPPTSVPNQRCSSFPPERLTERHFIRRIPITEEMRANISHRTNLGRRRCVWCTNNGRKSTTVYECIQCGLPLCLDTCFEAFHTQP